MPKTQIASTTIVLTLAFFLIILPPANPQAMYYFEVGARGDDNSKNNIGVRAEIRTHLYNTLYRDRDYFYVEDSFGGGSAIFFGYSIRSSENGVARWDWASVTTTGKVESDFGATGSAGLNGTWHSYSITRDSTLVWSFTLDGAKVDATVFETTQTSGPVSFAAQKITYGPSELTLGPVEFRNLSYLKSDGWHEVNSLRAISICVVNEQMNSPCNVNISYGVLALGSNHILAGSGMPKHADADVLWSTNPIDYLPSYLIPVALVAVAILSAYFAIRRRLVVSPYWKPTLT